MTGLIFVILALAYAAEAASLVLALAAAAELAGLYIGTGWCDHGAGVLVAFRRVGVRVGWGWTDDLPLRPWPAGRFERAPHSYTDACVAWCGFYFGVSKVTL